jgi:hypothetical protein
MTRHQLRMQCLGFYEEAIGTLSEMTEDEGFLLARIGKLDLVLPTEMEDKLRPLVGMKVGIIHTDIPGREYLVRVIQEFGQKTPLMTDHPRELAHGVA